VFNRLPKIGQPTSHRCITSKALLPVVDIGIVDTDGDRAGAFAIYASAAIPAIAITTVTVTATTVTATTVTAAVPVATDDQKQLFRGQFPKH
jgi:hypothetical protein